MPQFDFDLNDDIYKSSPGYWPLIVTLQNNNIELEDLLCELNIQINELENLGVNYLNQYNNIIPMETLKELLLLINEKYIDIPYIEIIISDYDKCLVYFTSLYEFLFVDFIKDVLPLITTNKFEEIRTIILNHINTKLTQLNILYKINLNLKPEMIKNSILLDIFNNDLEIFYESFISIILVKYLNN
jgi:hypothetical protein